MSITTATNMSMRRVTSIAVAASIPMSTNTATSIAAAANRKRKAQLRTWLC